jgi:hypothetical protein
LFGAAILLVQLLLNIKSIKNNNSVNDSVIVFAVGVIPYDQIPLKVEAI